MKKSKKQVSLAAKLSLLISAMVVISSVAVGAFGYILYRNDSLLVSADKALAIAKSVAAQLDGDRVRDMLADYVKDETWDANKAMLDKVKTDTDVTYLYVIDKRYTDKVFSYASGEKPGQESNTADLGQTDLAEYYAAEMFDTLATGSFTTTSTYYTEEYGNLVSGFAPVQDGNGAIVAVVGVDLTVSDVMQASTSFGVKIILIVVAFCVVFGVFSLWYVTRYIGRPVNALAQASQRIAQGDLDIQLAAASQDEIGRLTASFREMLDSSRKQIQAIEALAAGDLTVSLPPRCPEDAMNQALSAMLENLRGMFGEIQRSTLEVAEGARRISDGSASLAQGATEQASAVEELSSSIAHIAEQTRKNAHDSDGVNKQALAIRANAEQGSGKMQRMVKAVQDINEASHAISKIIKTIDDIAFQTNILALNASVEAARAGQQGRGFSVVADEVKSLANRSQAAAQETNELILNSLKLAEDGVDMARDTESALQAIVTGIEGVADVIGGIAMASNEQAVAIDQINLGIDQVSRVVQQNNNTSQESASASAEMSNQSEILQELVSHFKLEQEIQSGRRLRA